MAGGPRIGEWHRIKLDVVGNIGSYYIDGEPQHRRNDNSHPLGGVFLYAYGAIAEFDNVVITGDDIPNTGPSGYAVQPKAKLAATWGWLKG